MRKQKEVLAKKTAYRVSYVIAAEVFEAIRAESERSGMRQYRIVEKALREYFDRIAAEIPAKEAEEDWIAKRRAEYEVFQQWKTAEKKRKTEWAGE